LAWAFISCAIWVARAFLVISLLLIVKVRQPNRPYKMQLLGRLHEARTIVPSVAIAEIDIRLVLESDPDRLINLVREHIVDQGYYVIDRKPTSRERLLHDKICQFTSSTSYLAFRTDFDSEVGRWLDRALVRAFGESPIKQRTSGGSIPISPFVNELGIPAVTVPTVNRDNNQHSPNENIRVGNYVDGIKTMHYILTEKL
jgi:acetylornithine deacetylase/succinyl-diaminopimelate desuccinylase-like protein